MTQDKLKEMLDNHAKWLSCEGGERADLRGANLRGANLYGADLREAKRVPYIPMTCPDAGTFVGWKKASKDLIVKLLIPEDAKRSSGTSRKCRCDKAVVLAIENPNVGDSGVMEVASMYDSEFIYRVGETVTVQDYDDDRWNECSAGIHFFINRQEAVNYGE